MLTIWDQCPRGGAPAPKNTNCALNSLPPPHWCYLIHHCSQTTTSDRGSTYGQCVHTCLPFTRIPLEDRRILLLSLLNMSVEETKGVEDRKAKRGRQGVRRCVRLCSYQKNSRTRDAVTGIVLSRCCSLKVTLIQNDPLALLSMNHQPCTLFLTSSMIIKAFVSSPFFATDWNGWASAKEQTKVDPFSLHHIVRLLAKTLSIRRLAPSLHHSFQ